MENTNEFVKKIKENQRKDEQNKKRQGDNNPSKVLPNKKH
jgi:hypothetical protein